MSDKASKRPVSEIHITATDMDRALFTTIDYLRDWQKERGITRECISNTAFTLRLFKTYASPEIKSSVKAQPVMVVGVNQQGQIAITGMHLAIRFCGSKILDPSHEIASLKNVQYFDNTESFKQYMRSDKLQIIRLSGCVDNAIAGFAEFQRIADRVNSTDGTANCIAGANKQYLQELQVEGVKKLEQMIDLLGHKNPTPSLTVKQKPNDQCLCKSGKKYKKCCGGIKTCSK